MERYAATQLSPLTSPSSSVLSALTSPTSPPMTSPDTGILSSYKLASQKITELTNRCSPCKMACTYHVQLSATKTQVQVQRTKIPVKVPRNERVTLPQVITEPPPTSSPITSLNKTFSYTPFLTPNLSDKPSSVSRHSTAERSIINNLWKNALRKADSQKQQKKLFRPWSMTPKNSSLDQPSCAAKSDSSTTFTKKKSLMKPLCSSTPVREKHSSLGKVFNPMCSQFYSIMRQGHGSCDDPEGIRERTRNLNILTLNEHEEGDNVFSQEIWDIRAGGPGEPISSHIETSIPSASTSLPTVPSLSSTHDTTLPPESTKRKQFCSNKHLPPKKRFSDNFCESSVSMSPKRMADLASGASKKPTGCKNRKNSGIWYYGGSTFLISGTSRTSRAREPIKTVCPTEETILQLEEVLETFMSSKKTTAVLMLNPTKQKLLIDYAHLCFITAVRSKGGVRLRKNSASRAPIPMDKEWMLS